MPKIPKEALIPEPFELLVERLNGDGPLAPSIEMLPGGNHNDPPSYIVRRVKGRHYEYLHLDGTWHETTQNENGTFTGIYPSRTSAAAMLTLSLPAPLT